MMTTPMAALSLKWNFGVVWREDCRALSKSLLCSRDGIISRELANQILWPGQALRQNRSTPHVKVIETLSTYPSL